MIAELTAESIGTQSGHAVWEEIVVSQAEWLMKG